MRKTIREKFYIRLPEGRTGNNETMVFIIGLIIAVILSFRFVKSLQNAITLINGFYIRTDNFKYVFPTFTDLIEGAFTGFILLAVILMMFIPVYYFYHLQTSKSIYLMKRLPIKHEFIRRCVSLPVFHISITLLTGLLLYLLYLMVYLVMVPKDHFPENIF